MSWPAGHYQCPTKRRISSVFLKCCRLPSTRHSNPLTMTGVDRGIEVGETVLSEEPSAQADLWDALRQHLGSCPVAIAWKALSYAQIVFWMKSRIGLYYRICFFTESLWNSYFEVSKFCEQLRDIQIISTWYLPLCLVKCCLRNLYYVGEPSKWIRCYCALIRWL